MTDWDKLKESVDQIAEEAEARTDARLAGELAAVTRLTAEDIQRHFPAAADAKRLLELMEIVQSATNRNEKVQKLVQNAEKFAGVVLTLLTKIA